MFAIAFEDETNHQWACEFIFTEFADAKKYLIKQGFIEKKRIFERTNYNWSTFIKAYISPVKVFQPSAENEPV